MASLSQYTTVRPDWPSGSPDLNSIENLWGIIKLRVGGQRPDSLEQMTDLVFQICESLDQSLADSLIDLMSSRLQGVVDANERHPSD
jgi:hypothetical protein